MNNSFGLTHIVQFFLFVALQVLLMGNLALYSTGFCFIYVAFLLYLPLNFSRIWLLILGFLIGFTVDVFYDTMGIHAAASVLLAFLRPHVLNLLTPRDGYDNSDTVNIHVMGSGWFLSYAFTLILFHHLAVFFLETLTLQTLWYTLAKTVLSTLFTGIVVVIIQLLFFSPKRERIDYR
ncbi:hypothetical protein [Pontibacter mangrovi]|uniref:Rod shape-determining protein MreD n=1 Tax=Pontibacter mangrovi TaxID=2589816 RepID=A0A501W4X4_9BACT|nr:hypothetical protein [Pontibacter mangrovi]TPE44993.1 hypothetical protein FJM65_08245 [Pontibacter mangrovi]